MDPTRITPRRPADQHQPHASSPATHEHHLVHVRRDLTDCAPVFHDRQHAGRILAAMLTRYRETGVVVAAVVAGGVPVAVPIAHALHGSLCPVVVSKIVPPWNTEIGYGAVAFDGSVELNHALMARLGIDRATRQQGIEDTRDKVMRRVRRLGEPRIGTSSIVILVDDGIASGFTTRVAIKALRGAGAHEIVVAVPTAPTHTAAQLATEVDSVYCANLRSGPSFAVAGAYQHWCDVGEEEAIALLSAERAA